jgi:hypothetical protein
LSLFDEVAAASGAPEEGFDWIIELQREGVSFDAMADSSRFPTLDAKLATALTKILKGDLERRISLLKEEAIARGTPLRGRQILYLIFEQFKLNEHVKSSVDFQHLLAVSLNKDDLRRFITTWDEVLAGVAYQVDARVLEFVPQPAAQVEVARARPRALRQSHCRLTRQELRVLDRLSPAEDRGRSTAVEPR